MNLIYKIIIIVNIFFILNRNYGEEISFMRNFEFSFYQNILQTNFKTGQRKEKNIQNVLFTGFEYFYKNDFKEEDNFLVHLHQIALFNYEFLEDQEILRSHKREPKKIYLYTINSTFISIYYKNAFLLLGYANPYQSIVADSIKNLPVFKKISVFPSLDIRLDFKDHIITFSPLFFYNKEQKFVFSNKEKDLAFLHYYKKENFTLESNNHNFNHKIHYAFLNQWFHLYLSYYSIFQENLYSNQKNVLELNFYDYHLVFRFSPFVLRLQMSESLGTFSKDKYNYKIKGNRLFMYLIFNNKNFQFYIEIGKSEPSKWNQFSKSWEYFGFTSIFEDYISSLQMSTSYKISPHYEICYNIKNNCEGIESLINDFHFIIPANFADIGLHFSFSMFQFMISVGYFQNNLLVKKDPVKEFESYQNLSYYLIGPKKDFRLELLEPNFSFIIHTNKITVNLTYSQFFKNDYESKKFQFVSHSILLSFLYTF